MCIERDTTNILGDTQLTIQQRGVSNCSGWKGDSKRLDGLKDGDDGDEYQLSAFKLWQSSGSSETEPAWKYPAQRVSYPTISSWVELIVGTSCVGTTAADQRVENFINIYFSFSLMWQSPMLTSYSSLQALAPIRTSNYSDSSLQRN